MYKLTIIATLLFISCGETASLQESGSVRKKESNASDYSAVSHNPGLGSYTPPINNVPLPSNTADTTPSNPTQAPTPQPATPAKQNCLRSNSNRKGLGPYSVGTLKDFSGYTVFYPQEMSNENCLFMDSLG